MCDFYALLIYLGATLLCAPCRLWRTKPNKSFCVRERGSRERKSQVRKSEHKARVLQQLKCRRGGKALCVCAPHLGMRERRAAPAHNKNKP